MDAEGAGILACALRVSEGSGDAYRSGVGEPVIRMI